jgi:hypothetical protein
VQVIARIHQTYYNCTNQNFMKRMLVVLVTTLILASCSKDDNNNNNQGTPGMTAKIDGSAKTYGVPVATRSSGSTNEYISISGATSTGEGLSIFLAKNGTITTGSYNASMGQIVLVVSSSEQYATNGAMNVTISAIDASHVEGTFAGTAEPNSSGGTSKSITEGKFYAKF